MSLAPLLEAGFAIQLHAFAAIAALLLVVGYFFVGGVMLLTVPIDRIAEAED